MTIHSPRTRGGPALAGAVAVLLGVGLAPALAGPATPVSAARVAAAHPHHHRATTHLHGFAEAPASVPLGAMVVDKVGVRPRARRVIRVQAIRPGGTSFVTVSSGHSTKAGGFLARYVPTTAGAWRFRLVIPATQHAKGLVSASRGVTSTTTPTTTDTTPPGPVSAVTVKQATGSDLTLSWSNPGDGDLAGVVIRRSLGATPPTSATAGTAVTTTAKTATSFTDTGLASNTTYSYALFAFDTSTNVAPAVTGSAKTGAVTLAVLSLNGSTGASAKETVNQSQSIDISGTQAGTGLTLVSGFLDYGDGVTEQFSGDASTWAPRWTPVPNVGPFTATWTVVDSATEDHVSHPARPGVRRAATDGHDHGRLRRVLEKTKPVTFHRHGLRHPERHVIHRLRPIQRTAPVDDLTSGTGAPPATFTITFDDSWHLHRAPSRDSTTPAGWPKQRRTS